MDNQSPDSTMSEYEKQDAAIQKRLEKLAKSSGSDIVKGMLQEEDPKVQETSNVVCQLFHECMDEFESGEMTLEEAIDEFSKLAKSV